MLCYLLCLPFFFIPINFIFKASLRFAMKKNLKSLRKKAKVVLARRQLFLQKFPSVIFSVKDTTTLLL
jgi:hypothetical protein